MKIKFDSELPYQRQAINSLTSIFEGQTVKQSNFTVSFGEDAGMVQTDKGIGNFLELTSDDILKNLQDVQTQNNLPKSETLDNMNFTVEMETGTGKTYVYLRSIYELNQKYGFTKFVIVVPSIAIREGVYKSLQMTSEHFRDLYDNQPLEYFIYDSEKLDRVRSFSTATSIQVMIINIDAFRKSFIDPEKEDKANVIHRPNDRLNGYKPIEFIQETNPIVIIDEPQSVSGTDKSKEAIRSLHPLCTVGFSATPLEKYNMLYRLDAVDAYNEQLVKKIEVMSIRSEESFNIPYIKLVEVSERKAKVELDVETRGKVKRQTKSVKYGDDLYDISGNRELYSGYMIEQIDWSDDNESIEINSHLLRIGNTIGDLDDDQIKRFQIRQTIEEHLNKELRFNHRGIKVLSLFFIDKVSNYRDYNSDGNAIKGKYSMMFEEEYMDLIQKPKYRTLFEDIDIELEISEIHNGYFAQDKKGKLRDTRGNTIADSDVYNLIMKDKERLLSFDEPLRFIFSHSALREGWDNPNVFQICTLKDSAGTYVSRRQEIGRGLRLCVNQTGEREPDYNVNVLTVMANESYEEFVENLQKEMEKETGIIFGKIEEHAFANLAYLDAETDEPIKLGHDLSKQLHFEMKMQNYIDKNNKATSLLKEDLEEYAVNIPEEFSPWQAVILKELKRLTERLPIKDASKKKRVKLNKAIINSEEFLELWEKIKYKTVYSINFDSEVLMKKAIYSIQKMNKIDKVRIISRKDAISSMDRLTGLQSETLKEGIEDYTTITHKLPDVITELQNRTNLTRKTVVDILLGSKRLDDFKNNPQKFIEEVSKIILREMKFILRDGIRYHKMDDDYYAVELFQNQELLAYLNDNAIESDKSPYDHVIYDSDIEHGFAARFESDENVKVYVKLPNWFKIDTPIGGYNPDWAAVINKDGQEKLYFVIETKGTDIEEFLRVPEIAKIEFARKHFEALETEVEFEGPESDVSEFMMRVSK